MLVSYIAVDSKEQALELIDQFIRILQTDRQHIQQQTSTRTFLPEYQFPQFLLSNLLPQTWTLMNDFELAEYLNRKYPGCFSVQVLEHVIPKDGSPRESAGLHASQVQLFTDNTATVKFF